MNLVQKTTIAALAAFAAFSAAPASAVTISNPTGGYPAFGPLSGAPFVGGAQTQYVGQTFTTPISGQLTNLQFTLLAGSSLPSLYAVVYAWNGSTPGAEIWRSSTVSATSGLLNFNPTGATLTAGQTYVAFLSTFGLAGNTGSVNIDSCLAFSVCTTPVAGLGNAVTGTVRDDGVTFSNAFNAYDLKFSATITAPVPEPTTWAMMIVGFGAVGTTMRRRQKVRVSLAA